MKCAAILALAISLTVTSATAEAQITLPTPDEVTQHHHRCDYKVRPFTDPSGRVDDRIWVYDDPASGVALRVESDGRHLEEIDARGKSVWVDNPHMGLPAYRVDPPCIFALGPKAHGMSILRGSIRGYSTFRRRVVAITEGATGHYVGLTFDNSQFGFVDVKSGDFIFEGQN